MPQWRSCIPPNTDVHFIMSRAFVREDVDPPERSGRTRSVSGLPPGATNYITARGVQRLRDELEKIRSQPGNREGVAQLQAILDSVSVVTPPEEATNDVTFGSTVTVEEPGGGRKSYTVVGVDEVTFEPDGVSWISPIGKALLAAALGDRVTVGDQLLGRIVEVEYRGG